MIYEGGVWSSIAAPEKDADGNPTNCKLDKGCSLHLHGFSTSAFTWFYSVPNAIGLMMATGNLGDELLDRPDQVREIINSFKRTFFNHCCYFYRSTLTSVVTEVFRGVKFTRARLSLSLVTTVASS